MHSLEMGSNGSGLPWNCGGEQGRFIVFRNAEAVQKFGK